MSRAVYLHIGAPKTGTTYVQDRLARNVRSLARHDVHVPTRPLVSPGLFHFRAALDLLGQDWGGPTGHAVGGWDALMKRVRRARGTVLVSHEVLATATPEQVARAMDDLAGREVHVVYSARDLARQVPAAWQESIKRGRTWSYRRFLNRMEREGPWFFQAFDLPGVLGTWGAALPPERVHVVTVPQRRPPPGAEDVLWLRMCQAFGIDPAWAPRDSDRTNRSLGVVETQVVRSLNRRIDRATRREPVYDDLIREKLAQDRLVKRRSAPVRLPPDRFGWAEERAQEWIDWLAASGIDVIGDPEELRPVRPGAGERWRNPDKVKPKAQLKATVEALAAMTQEAASRPDPRRRLVTRARTHAGRLRLP
jgi:hypothetical protein